LELIPALTFLFVMHPQLKKADRSYSPTPDIQPQLHQSGLGVIISRVDSGIRAPEVENLLLVASGSNSSGQIRRETPLTLQSKGTTGYGSTTTGTNEASTKI
jgi:hypothetical protein